MYAYAAMIATATPAAFEADMKRAPRDPNWRKVLGPRRRAAGFFTTKMTAAELAAESRKGTVYTRYDTTANGNPVFAADHYKADAQGNLHCYRSDGTRVLIHPADRVLTVLRKHA